MHTETANFGVRDIMWTLSHIFMDAILKVYQHKRAVYKKSESNKKRPLINLTKNDL